MRKSRAARNEAVVLGQARLVADTSASQSDRNKKLRSIRADLCPEYTIDKFSIDEENRLPIVSWIQDCDKPVINSTVRPLT